MHLVAFSALAGPARGAGVVPSGVPRAIAVAAALLAFLWQAGRYPAVPNSDDAYIAFRYADNLARGAGPVFNPGERVEGYTDPLWVAALAAARRLGADTPRAAYLGSLALAAVTIALAALWPARLAPTLRGAARPGARSAPWSDPAGMAAWGAGAALLLGCSHALAFHAVQGLETSLMAATVTAALFALDPATGRPGWGSAAFFLLAMLTRPEGLLLFLVVAGTFAVRGAAAGRRPPARALLPCAATLLAYGCFLAWRLAYYGALVPNTYFAKRAAVAGDLAAGARYVGEWVAGGAGALVLVACLVVALAFGGRALLTWPFLLLGVHAAAVVTTGGDHFPLGRFFVPLAPLAAVIVALAAALLPALVRSARAARVAQGAALAAAAAALLLPGLGVAREAADVYARFTGKWVRLGKVLRERLPAGTTVALSPVGAIPYYSGLPTIDILGLTDAHVARVAADPAIARKGHQKHDGAYVLARRPDVIVLGNGLLVAPDASRPGELWWWPDAGFGPDGAAALGRRADLRSEGATLAYEADIESSPEFARAYRPALVPVQEGLDLLVWRRVATAP